MIDLRTGDLRKHYSANATRPIILDVPDLLVLTLDGEGDPATSHAWQDAVASLVALAWTVRAAVRTSDPAMEFKVMPLEGVWTLPDELTFSEDPIIRAQLRWTLQIVQPARIDHAVLERSRAEVSRKKPELGSIDRIELRTLPGTLAGQLLHRGSYRTETPTLDRIHRFIREHGGRPKPGHREIYLNDPRRTAPEKRKTILRVAFTQPRLVTRSG